MKKLLFLLLLSVSMYGQTLQNPTFGTVTTKTAPVVTSTDHLATVATDGKIGKILPENLPFYSLPTWSAGTYNENKAVKYLKDGIYYHFVSQIDGNTSEPQLVKSTQPWTAITGTLIGVWNSGTAYVNSNIVTYNGYFYQCITNNTNQNPELLAPPYWIKLGYDAGVWSGASTYHTYNVVSVGTSVYRSNLNENNFGVTTIKNHYWDEIKENSVQVDAWGDSLTFGSGASLNASYTSTLSFVSGLNVINFGVPGETSTQIRARFGARRDLFKNPVIIWAGRNNYASTATVLADIDAMVTALGHDKYLVLGIIRATSNGLTDLDSLNGALKTAYGSRFINVQDYLVEKYNPSVPQDVVDYANKNIPFSLRSDWLHLNNNGYAYVAELINNNKSFLLGNSNSTLNTVSSKGLFATGNKVPLEKNKRVEIIYDDVNDQGVIQTYDRILNVVKPTSISFTGGSELRLVENGGTLKIGDLPDYSSGTMKQFAMTSTSPRDILEIPSIGTNFIAKGLATGLNGASQIFDNGTNVIVGGSTPEGTWKFAIEGIAALGAIRGDSRLYVSGGVGFTNLQARDLTVATQMRYLGSSHLFDTNVTITGLAGTGTRQVVASSTGVLSAGAVQPLKYVANMFCSGGASATLSLANVGVNTLGIANPTISTISNGVYDLTFASPLSASAQKIYLSGQKSANQNMGVVQLSTSVIRVYLDINYGSTASLNSTYHRLEIEVYP